MSYKRRDNSEEKKLYVSLQEVNRYEIKENERRD